jgi:hypothetical protein
MFCQNCGAELRSEAEFCAVCGASAPRPTLRPDPEDRSNKAQRLQAQLQSRSAPTSGQHPHTGSSLLGPAASQSAPQREPRQIRSFQAIRQASGQRGSMRSLAPAASLAVPSSLPEQPLAQPEAAPDAPPVAPVVALSAPVVAVPPAPTNGHTPASPIVSAASTGQDNVQLYLNGYHPASAVAPGANGHTPAAPAAAYAPPLVTASAPANGYAPRYNTAQAAATGISLPANIPDRLILSALGCMFLSFLLPWVIISGARATPLGIGWPIIVPLAVILGTGLTILLPQRTRYTPFILALPFALGCFALGAALLVFLVSSAIAANSVGVAFLGVDIGFIFFALAAFVLACAGYFKLLRELPLLLAGHIRLAPLPGMLGRLASAPAQPPTPQHPMPNNAHHASAGPTESIDQTDPSA